MQYEISGGRDDPQYGFIAEAAAAAVDNKWLLGLLVVAGEPELSHNPDLISRRIEFGGKLTVEESPNRRKSKSNSKSEP